MGRLNDIYLLGAFEYDAVTNALDAPDAVLAGGGIAATDLNGIVTGPRPVQIHELVFIARDLTFTDPAANRFLGYTIDYTINGGGAYTTALAVTADADLPQIWDDTGNDTEDFALDTPVNAFGFRSDGDASTPSTGGPVRIPANAVIRIRVGTYVSGALAAVTGLDDVDLYVFGRHV